MAMSSVTDPDGFTTVSCHGCMSSPSPPKQRPQSCSPPRQGNEIKRVNLFDDKFLSSFPPSGGHAMDSAVTVEAANTGDQKKYDKQGKRRSPGNFFPSPFLVQLAGHPNINEEPGKRGSPCKIFPPSLKGKLGVPDDVHEVALLSRTPLAGTGCNGLSQNIS